VVFLCYPQLEDIIKFGLDRLFGADESSDENIDFTSILGPTIDGQWQQADSALITLVNLLSYEFTDKKCY